jgi:hypothetical protein
MLCILFVFSSPVFGHRMNYLPLLGGIKRSDSGFIVSAKSIRMFWVVHVNFSSVDYDKSGNLAGTGDLVSTIVLH